MTHSPGMPVSPGRMDDYLDDALVSRYLRVLGVARSAPSLETLEAIVAAHLYRIPFENISKLRRYRAGQKSVPDTASFLEGIERFHFGGTCYSNNYHLYCLLCSLGYEAKLFAADMVTPGVHMVVVVTLSGREYLLDVGYAAPFLAAMPRDLSRELVMTAGGDRYVLHPQSADGSSRLELFRGGELKHFYVVRPGAKTLEDFGEVIERSYGDNAIFMNAILLARFSAAYSVVIHNLTLMESHSGAPFERRMVGREELPACVEGYFGIPKHLVAEAMREVRGLRDAWN